MKNQWKNYRVLLLVLFVFCGNALFSQKIDSLKHIQGNDTTQISNLIEIGKLYAKKNFDSTTFYLDSAIHYAHQIKDYSKVWKVYYTKANLYRIQDSLSKALFFYQKAMDIADSNHLELMKAKALHQFTVYGVVSNDPPAAYGNYLKVLETYKKYNFQSGITKVYNNLAVCHINCKKFKDAEKYMQKAYETSIALQDTSLSIDIQINLGLLYLKQKKYKSSQKLFDKLIHKVTELHKEEKLDHIYYNLGLMKVSQGEFQTALNYYNKALRQFQLNKDEYYTMVLKLQKAYLFLDLQKQDSAKQYLIKSVADAVRIGNIDIEELAQNELLKIYKQEKNFIKAFEASQRINEILEQSNGQKNSQSIEIKELVHQNKEKQEIISLKDQIIKSEKSKKNLYFILLFILFLLLISLIIAIISSLKSHEKSKQLYEQKLYLNQVEYEKSLKDELIRQLEYQKMEEELNNKQRQLVSTALLIEQNQRLLQQISKDINNIIDRNPKDISLKEIKRLGRNLKLKQVENNQWNLFKTYFDQSYKDFIVNLQQKHPDLTKMELKFCTYLRIQLPSKQIASIMNIAPETIYKTRYKIRKKLKLSKEESLDTYLLEF